MVNTEPMTMTMTDAAELHIAGLELLLAAVHAGDPKRELLVRVGDAIREAKALAAQQDGVREAAIEECAKIADGMARIGRDMIAENNAYQARSGNPATDANKFCQHRVSVAEEIAAYIRRLPKRRDEQGTP
jgi:hypothetical protein